MNYKVKITSTEKYGMDRRKIGDIVFAHIDDDGKVLFFDLHDRKKKLPIFDVWFDNIEEAKMYGTCISKTDFDVKSAWKKMMSDRYW